MGSLYSVSSTTGDITTAGSVISNTTSSGLLFPRLTTVQRDAIASPSAGMQIYNTDNLRDEFYNGTVWGPISSGGTPAGNNKDIQFNNSGAFGGSDSFQWDDANKRVSIFSTGSVENRFQASDSQFVILSTTPLLTLETTNGSGVNINDNGNDTQVAINATGTPDASAVLDLGSSSANLGFLPPRITTAQRNAITSPATGLQIYNTDTNAIELWDGSNWQSFGNTILLSDGGTLTSSGSLNIYADGLGSALPSLALRTSTQDPTFTNGDIRVFSSNVQIKDSSEGQTTTALLQLTSTTAGFLPPRLTTAQRNAIASPAEGLIVYNTDSNTIDSFNGTSWNSGNGVASAPFTNQGTDISSTPLFTPSSTGVFRISIYLVDTTASLGAGAVQASITYIDDSGNTQTLSTSTVALATLGSFTQSDFVIEATSGNAVSYSTSHTGVFGSAKYSVYFAAERIA